MLCFCNRTRLMMAVLAACMLSDFALAKSRPDYDDFEKPVLLPVQVLIDEGLHTLNDKQWGRREVSKVLQAFAYGGQATDMQIAEWADMSPQSAITEILNFEPINLKLSPQGVDDPSTQYCHSLEELQTFWSSDDPQNPMRDFNRPWYQVLAQDDDVVDPLHLFLTWSRLAHSPGCNTFLHKLALYITNYHASIHILNSGPTLIRSYYDDVVQGLAAGDSFVDLMTLSATHASLSFAYGHMDNHFDQNGEFQGNDDFAREYFQLLFGIEGSTDDEDYHENVTIEHNAWLLTGMGLDAQPFAWDSSNRLDWLVSPIRFDDHIDPAGRRIWNQSAHYEHLAGEDSCLEILHEMICGRNASEKLHALAPVAAAHPESMASTPVKIVRFFGDDNPDARNIAAIQQAWNEAEYDLLTFLRAYATSTAFHNPDSFKLRSAFDRNLLIQNANQLTAQEAYARPFYESPTGRMYEQGALIFAPIRDVFGGQTGTDASNDRYVFKKAWDANVTDPWYLGSASEYYRLTPEGQIFLWRKDWGSVIPINENGDHVVSAVADWIWNRFIGDAGKNFDVIARAQVYALLATGVDFGAIADENNMQAVYTSEELSTGELAGLRQSLGATIMDLSTEEANERVGLIINFITALPYTFARENR